MPRSRTIITLCALLVAMTAGTFILMALETSPALPAAGLSLAARMPSTAALGERDAELIWRTTMPIRPDRWRCIVVHDGACDLAGEGAGEAVAAGCHFVVHGADGGGDGAIEATRRWREQTDGDHVRVPGVDLDAESIGICLTGDLSVRSPSRAQSEALVGLIHVLQRQFDIPDDRVWLHGDLTGRPCPGNRFAAARFRELLLTRR